PYRVESVVPSEPHLFELLVEAWRRVVVLGKLTAQHEAELGTGHRCPFRGGVRRSVAFLVRARRDATGSGSSRSAPPDTDGSPGICVRCRIRRRNHNRRGSAGPRCPPPTTPRTRAVSPCSPRRRTRGRIRTADTPSTA